MTHPIIALPMTLQGLIDRIKASCAVCFATHAGAIRPVTQEAKM